MMRQPKIDEEADDELRRFLELLEHGRGGTWTPARDSWLDDMPEPEFELYEPPRGNGLAYPRVALLLQLLKSLDTEQNQAELERKIGAVNELCELYHWTARVWRPASMPRGSLTVIHEPTHKELSSDEHWEHWAVGRVLRFAREQSWARVQQCQNPDCLRWYLSKKVQRGASFCKAACRQKVHASDPERRAAKNAKARETYRRVQRRNRVQDAAAGLQPAKTRK